MPEASFARSNSWRIPSRLATTSRAVSTRSYVVKRLLQLAHSRRRRIVAESSRSRESTTRVSRAPHWGQRIVLQSPVTTTACGVRGGYHYMWGEQLQRRAYAGQALRRAKKP